MFGLDPAASLSPLALDIQSKQEDGEGCCPFKLGERVQTASRWISALKSTDGERESEKQ